MIKLSDFVIDFIYKAGVKHLFMLPGGGCINLVDSVGRHPKLKYIVNLHEQACAIAAEAYSQYTNEIGGALVTTGPGATNAITGVASAWLDSIPCFIISGQVKRADMIGNKGIRQMGFQEINIIDMVKHITKYAVTILEPDKIKYHLEKALYLAKNGRSGPVWIDVPLDVQSSMIDENKLIGFDKTECEKKIDLNLIKQNVSETIDFINKSERPIILVGNGVRLSNAEEKFIKLVEQLNIPILTTWKAIDMFDENHPLYIGRPGAIGQRGANFAQQNSDLIIVIGARLDLGQTGYTHNNFAREAKKIMIDIDVNEINKMDTTIDIKSVCDAKIFIEEVLNQIAKVKTIDRTYWMKKCKDWKTKYPVILPEYQSQEKYVNDYVLIDLLSDKLNKDDILVPGSSGACSERAMQAFRVKKGQKIFNSEGLGAMGFGISSAIGGCIASGNKRTICIEGDGGFIMNVQELETVKRLNLPIKLFILNNEGYVSIRTTQKNFYNSKFVGSSVESGLTLPDYIKVGESYGIKSIRISTNTELKEKLDDILNSTEPILCELMIDPDQVTMPRISNYQKEDGTFVSRPLEDLWPFLDREEFKQNMIIKILEE